MFSILPFSIPYPPNTLLPSPHSKSTPQTLLPTVTHPPPAHHPITSLHSFANAPLLPRLSLVTPSATTWVYINPYTSFLLRRLQSLNLAALPAPLTYHYITPPPPLPHPPPSMSCPHSMHPLTSHALTSCINLLPTSISVEKADSKPSHPQVP
ncbi:unnamed protein product [Hydatigera taeniaeformis]|uniref:Ovule protein n=1 Tax=Hydatigena taeniaeformis TaxID=6205 RepID=A0A0R3WRY9_HYDTA|nr:unnamed protein product [Hydatigera taeniaeformis]